MPQMAPLSWLILFCLFTASFFLFTIMNYFNKFFISKNNNTNSNLIINNNSLNKNLINWKW